MSELAAELRRARERARLSVQDLSARTKIRASLLDAIERGHFEQLPRGLLTRGFLRAYAREVGLDPESVIREYLSELEAERPEAEPAEPESVSAPSGRWKQLLLMTAVAAALAGVIVTLIRAREEADRFDASTYAPAGPIEADASRQVGALDVEPAAEPPVLEPEEADADAAPAVSTADRLRLEIRPTAVVWIGAVADGRQTVYELVGAGERRLIEAEREIRLRIGDASAFGYSINGVPGRPVGAPGQVRDLWITIDNYATFQDQ